MTTFGCSILRGFRTPCVCIALADGLTVLFCRGLGDMQSAGRRENGVKLSFDSRLKGANSEYCLSALVYLIVFKLMASF